MCLLVAADLATNPDVRRPCHASSTAATPCHERHYRYHNQWTAHTRCSHAANQGVRGSSSVVGCTCTILAAISSTSSGSTMSSSAASCAGSCAAISIASKWTPTFAISARHVRFRRARLRQLVVLAPCILRISIFAPKNVPCHFTTDSDLAPVSQTRLPPVSDKVRNLCPWRIWSVPLIQSFTASVPVRAVLGLGAHQSSWTAHESS